MLSFYADDIVLLSGSLCKLQLMLNRPMCNDEMQYLELKFNTVKCHVLRIGKNYANDCNNVYLGNFPIAFDDSLMYLATVIRAGRTWRTDSTPRRRQCFRAFNSIATLNVAQNQLSNSWLNLFVCLCCCIMLLLSMYLNLSVLNLNMFGML